MAYQYHQSTNYKTYNEASLHLGMQVDNRFNQTVGNATDPRKPSVLSLGAVGDILTGTVLQGGDSPIVEMNGTPIKVRSDALKNTSKGEQIYLQITRSTDSEITMKLVDQSAIGATSRNGSIQTEIMKNTAQFVENWKQYQDEHSSNSEVTKDDGDYVLQSITSEEKAKLRQMGIEVTTSNLTMIKGLLAQMRGKEQDADLQRSIEDIKNQIMLENPQKNSEELQITIQEQTLDIPSVAEEANGFLPITEEQSVYLIQNNLSLNLENLYKAQYSAKSMPTNNGISTSAFEQMLPQIERTIQAAGKEVSEDSLNAARFLLNHRLPVTTDSLLMYSAIQDVNENGFSPSRIMENLTDTAAEHLANREESFIVEADYRRTELYFSSPSAIANQIVKDMEQITEQGFHAFSATHFPYTLELLSAFCQNYSPRTDSSTSDREQYETSAFQSEYGIESAELSSLTAHRQLEEIRLKMTWEASYTLATEDIHIRAKELSEVVEALRNQERNYYTQQFQAQDIEPTNEMVRLTQDTNRKIQELPNLPASALATTYFSGSFTLERLHDDGTKAISRMHATVSYTQVTSYETLMTRPRGDMGDSIQKAFRNVANILEEMHLPATEDNQRAVRILGYNEMEITPDNLIQIKAADQQVQSLIQNLQPSIVLNLVRDGVNPLNMPIEELNELVQNYINEDGITEEEKYSEFLQKLDRKKDITSEERQSYIGIYRLLDKVTKSKGKDIGTLVRNGQSLTLQNLLTAHRSNRTTGLDTTVDSDFGGFEKNQEGPSIHTQIEQAFTQYNQGIAENLFRRVTPDLIANMTEEAANGTTLEEFFDTIQNQLPDDYTDGTSATGNTTSDATTDTISAEQQIQESLLQELDTFTNEAGHFMKVMDIFPSITNMVLSADILRGNCRTFRDANNLSEQSPKLTDDDTPQQQMEELSDHLNSPEEMEAAYAKLEQTITETVHQADTTGTITAMDIQALKQVRAGLRIMQKMSRKEQFEIPFSVNGRWNVMHVSIIQNKEEKGRLEASVPNTDYGTLSASLTWKESHWEGSLHSDTQNGTTLLERNQYLLSDALETMSSNIDNTPTANDMYRIAKQLVVLMKQLAQ